MLEEVVKSAAKNSMGALSGDVLMVTEGWGGLEIEGFVVVVVVPALGMVGGGTLLLGDPADVEGEEEGLATPVTRKLFTIVLFSLSRSRILFCKPAFSNSNWLMCAFKFSPVGPDAPASRLFMLNKQMNRSAANIPANLIEFGTARAELLLSDPMTIRLGLPTCYSSDEGATDALRTCLGKFSVYV
mmetsp:Transcript_26813/g.56013  ORF Transcript_26813/g.56013 Transcript_26813/m.56013 type:complete len:186 (-) Transcript_26813:86-643(-)